MYDKQFLLDELNRYYEEHGRIPKARELNNRSGYPNWISYRKYFGSLYKALIAAGLPVTTFRFRPKFYTNKELILCFLSILKSSQSTTSDWSVSSRFRRIKFER